MKYLLYKRIRNSQKAYKVVKTGHLLIIYPCPEIQRLRDVQGVYIVR